MAFNYEVTVDALLSGVFRDRFKATLEKAGFEVALELANPEGPYVVSFRRGKDTVTMSIWGQIGQRQRRLTISSPTLDLTQPISETVKTAARELVVYFLAPLSEEPEEKLDARIRAYLCDIDEDVYPFQGRPVL